MIYLVGVQKASSRKRASGYVISLRIILDLEIVSYFDLAYTAIQFVQRFLDSFYIDLNAGWIWATKPQNPGLYGSRKCNANCWETMLTDTYELCIQGTLTTENCTWCGGCNLDGIEIALSNQGKMLPDETYYWCRISILWLKLCRRQSLLKM